MARLWWSDLDSFIRDSQSATDDRLFEMRDWAEEHEQQADRPGTGRNPKAQRAFRQMRKAAEAHLDERGLLWR